MPKTITNKTRTSETKEIRPALSPEAVESQGIALAMNLALQQLQDGTASSQVITHFLKLGSSNNQLEKENLASKNEMMKAKTENLRSSKRIEELYANALDAMKTYSGKDNE